MACFLIPVAEAVLTAAVSKILRKRESDFAPQISRLNKMLWGGSALLAFEHVWHGEVILQFPFLTAVRDGAVDEMLAEMFSTGVLMSVIITVAWLGTVAVSYSAGRYKLAKPAYEQDSMADGKNKE